MMMFLFLPRHDLEGVMGSYSNLITIRNANLKENALNISIKTRQCLKSNIIDFKLIKMINIALKIS